MKQIVFSALTGLIFGIGLTLSQMIDPARVLGFFNLFEVWDPTLAFVMAGALVVSIPGFYWLKFRSAPIADSQFHWPTRQDVDKNLVLGAIIFGTGWAIVGLCPGPAFAGLALLNPESWIFVAAMLVGLLAGPRFAKQFF